MHLRYRIVDPVPTGNVTTGTLNLRNDVCFGALTKASCNLGTEIRYYLAQVHTPPFSPAGRLVSLNFYGSS